MALAVREDQNRPRFLRIVHRRIMPAAWFREGVDGFLQRQIPPTACEVRPT